MTDISGTFTAITTLLKTSKALINVRDEIMLGEIQAQFQTSVIELQDWVMDFQKEKTLLLEEILELKAVISEYEKKKSYGDDYVRTNVASYKFAYVHKDYVGSFEKAHMYCCDCFEQGKYSTLDIFFNPYPKVPTATHECNACGYKVVFPANHYNSR